VLIYNPASAEHEAARVATRCKQSLAAFVFHAWPAVDPAPLKFSWHISAICDHLQAVTKGQIQKLIINCPPGVCKSTCVSVMWPAWEWIERPGEQSLFGSYDIALALRDSDKCRVVFMSDWYQDTFRPRWRLSRTQNAKGFYNNTLGGNRYTFGMLAGGKTGWRGNKVVLDDPNNVLDQYDARVKQQTYDVFNNVISTRVNDISTSSFVVIQQRMATDDMTGRLLMENEELSDQFGTINDRLPFEWVHLKLPMEGTSRPCTTVIGWKDPRKEGEILQPERYPPEALAYMRTKKLGAHGYASQYQQEPTLSEGTRFRKSDFLYWEDIGRGAVILHKRHGLREIVNLKLCPTFVSCDMAASEEQQADFTVYETWAITPGFDMLLLDLRRGRWAEPEAVRNAVGLYNEVRYNEARHICFVVETTGLGLPLAQAMEDRGLPILKVAINRMDKFARSATAAIRTEAGQIFFPDPATPWLCDPRDGFEVELLRFPAYSHDDQVDAFSLACEAVYQVGITGLSEAETLPKEARAAVEVMERRKGFGSMGKRFFGRR
jgi:predicted phage terminase large subunit-like protein